MSHVKLDISNIHHEVLSIGGNCSAVAAKIREVMKERGLNLHDIHRLCVYRYEARQIDFAPAYLTIHKFVSGRGAKTTYDVVCAIVEALGYEICGTRTMIEGDAIKIVDGGQTSFSIPKRFDHSKNFRSKTRKADTEA